MIGLITALVIAIPGCWVIYKKFQKYTSDDHLDEGEMIRLVFAVLLVVVGAWIGITSFVRVGTGYGLLLEDPLITHSVTGPSLGPAWTFRPPWMKPVTILYATTSTAMWTDQETGLRGEYPEVTVLSNDGLKIRVDIVLSYQLDPNSLIQLYQNFPDKKWEDRRIASIVREDVRDVLGNYDVIEIIEQREQISGVIKTTIKASLESEQSLAGAITNLEIDLRGITPSDTFLTAVDEKLRAEQENIQAEFERLTKLIQANATAQASILEAQGAGEAVLIKAQKQSEALEMVLKAIIETSNVTGIEAWDTYWTMQSLKEMDNIGMLIINIGEDGVPVILQP